MLLHNVASEFISKKKPKLDKDEIKERNSYMPTHNLARAACIHFPTVVIHTAPTQKLDSDNAERICDKIPDQYCIKGKSDCASVS